jgi:hypothetical protein
LLRQWLRKEEERMKRHPKPKGEHLDNIVPALLQFVCSATGTEFSWSGP